MYSLIIRLSRRLEKLSGCFIACCLDHLRQISILIGQVCVFVIQSEESERMIIFKPLPITHDQDTISIDNSGQPMRNQYHCSFLLCKRLTDFLLNKLVRKEVNIGRRLVNHNNLGLQEHSSTQTYQLLLPHREQSVTVVHYCV